MLRPTNTLVRWMRLSPPPKHSAEPAWHPLWARGLLGAEGAWTHACPHRSWGSRARWRGSAHGCKSFPAAPVPNGHKLQSFSQWRRACDSADLKPERPGQAKGSLASARASGWEQGFGKRTCKLRSGILSRCLPHHACKNKQKS